MFDSIIDVQQLNNHIDDPDWVIIDCRYNGLNKSKGALAFKQDHIKGAIYAHMDRDLSDAIIPGETGRHPFPSVEKIQSLAQLWGVNSNTQIVAYDDSHGGMAARLWFMFRFVGHCQIAVLNGGYQKWKESSYSISADIHQNKKGNFIARPDFSMIVDYNTVKELSDSAMGCIIDSRASNRYAGEAEHLDPLAGHIPSAINFPFTENVHPDGTWKSKEAIRDRFKGIELDEKSILYCGSGVTACHNLLALHYAGIAKSRLYPGSWSEWIFKNENLKITNKKNPWETKSIAVKYDNPWINVTHRKVINPSGGEGIYGMVHFKNIAIGIVPLDEDKNTWLVGQYRYTLNEFTWEIPEGGCPIGTPPLDSAKRELQEETGITANQWEQISELQTSNSVTDEIGIIYMATDLQFGESEPEETEDIQVKKVSLREALAMITNGEIKDAISIIGLLRANQITNY
ncbi:MAG: rhodanese-like domain-containing protein [Bacteroidota bacterium]